MAGKPYLRRGLAWAAGLGCSVGLALAVGAGGVWGATHYPPGAICYDCHAVSKSKMVEGTHLIKKSQKTVDLGITGGSTAIRCLFCHERNATPSVVDRDRMKGVWDHFDASSASKHGVYLQSELTPDGIRFDCRDCHTGIVDGVVSDGAGNAKVHTIDASGGTRLNLYGTLIGAPANASQLSTNTCQNVACHSAAGATNFGYTAPKRHSFTRTFPGTTQRVVTINDTTNPAACTDCHGKHNSYKNTSLITLRTDGTQSNSPSDQPADLVTPDKCGECHSQDDAGVYTAKGHGQNTISGGTIGCTACHTAGVRHSFGAASTNPLRFAFAENTTKQSAIRQKPPYNQVFSVCLTCHSQYSGKEHGAAAFAGCNDCHEPHGLGVSTNVKMIRRQIPKVNASGQLIYGASATTGTWESNFYTVPRDTTFKTDGTGLCDNAECHQGRIVAGDPLYPLSTFLTGGRHSGGDISTAADYDCESCHTHTDEGGSWGAKASCTTCHGQPPPPADSGYTNYAEANTPHQRHAASTANGGYGYPCQACHFDYTSSATHNTDPKTYQSLNFDVARNASPARAYNTGTATCTNLYCHSDGQSTASVGSAQWMTGTSTPNWSTQDLACNSCHGTTTSPNTLTYGAPDHANNTGGHTPNSHNRHAAYACRVCHFGTISDANPADGWTLANPPSAHVNNSKNLQADGTTATFTSTGTTPATCNTISCHNGGNAVWGVTLGCSDCHFRTTAQGGDLDNFVYGDGTLSAVNSDEWTSAGHGRTTAYLSGNPAGNFSGPASDPRGCAYCHSFLGTAQNPLVAHGVGTNPFRLANKSGTAEDNGWNNVCLVCHKTGDSGYDPDGVGGVYTSRNGAKNVDENHYGTKHTAASKGGTFCWDCHDPHGDDQHYMVQGGAGVTDVSDGVYGISVTRRPVTGLNVVGGYTSDDLANSNNTGLCQTCHATAGTIGGALSYNRDTFTPLANHNGADTQRCTACHTHDNDFGAGCTACHGYPPPDSPFAGTTATWTSDKAATPATLGAHNTHAAGTPYVSGDCNSTCHTSANHLTNKTSANMGVKAATVGASTGIYKYATADNFDNWLGGALAGNQSVVDDTCTNVSCHASTYSANSFRSAANPTYTRYWNQNLNCYACHAYDGVTAAAPRPTADKIATGSHAAHVDTYALACTNCHPSGAYTNAHRSGFVNFVANFGATRVPSATSGFYDLDGIAPLSTVANLVPRENGGTGYFCASVYCHSGGEPRGPETIAYRNDTRWTVASTGDCGTCHAVDAVAGSLTTNVHEKHVGSAAGQYGYSCVACHATVVGGTKPAYTIASTSLHVNGANNAAFAANEGTYATTGGTVAPDGGTCSATYCHSQGLDWSAPYTGTATAPVTVADWDTAQGTAGCGYCHGNPPAYANNATIRPAATNLTKKNSHGKHAGYTCDRCHYATTQDGSTIATPANHANKAWDVAANAGAGVTFTVAVAGTLSDAAYTPTTCNTISCHGGGNAQWGATLTCADCHVRTTAQGGDLGNWNIADGIAAMINSDEWAAAGHGRTTAYPSGNPAGNFGGPASDPQGCAYCHSFLGTANNPLVTHGVGINPFRLANKSGTGEDNGWNNVCLVCHRAGDSGYDPDGGTANYTSRNGARNVDENHYGTKHTAATKGGTFCWDCHDPHGDAQHYMVHSGDGSAPGRGVTDVSDGAYGVPVSSRPVTGLIVDTGGYTSADLANAANTGLCQTCHAASGGALYYNRSTFTALNLHNGADTVRCTACHTHDQDFSPTCNGCHGVATDTSGRPPEAPRAGARIWAASVDPATGASTGVGNHRTVSTTTPQVQASSHGTFGCVECHTSTPGVGADHNDGGLNATMTNLTARKWTDGATPTVWAPNADGATTSVVDDTCNNVDCHSPYYANLGTALAPTNAYKSGTPKPYLRYWASSNAWDCYTCHGYDGITPRAGAGGAAGPRVDTGSHFPHLVADPTGLSEEGSTYACMVCHVNNAGNNAHKDGLVSFSLSVAFDPYGTTATYTHAGKTPTGGVTAQGQRAYGTCSNLYCHSTVQSNPPGAPPTYHTPTWGQELPCAGCHGPGRHVANGMTTASHAKHTRFDCRLCHTTSGCMSCHGRNNPHVNGFIDVPLQHTTARNGITVTSGIYDTNNDGMDNNGGVPGQAFGRCLSVTCHYDGKSLKSGTTVAVSYAAPITWGAANPGCEGCHGREVANASGTYSYGAPDYANQGTSTQAANSHGAHVNGGMPCAACHQATTTDTNPAGGWTLVEGTTVAATPHLNAVVNVALAPAYDMNGAAANYDAATKACSGVSCHGTSTPAWGQQNATPLGCQDCHLVATADVDDFVWGGFNGTAAALNQTEWATTGHGLPAFSSYASGNPGAGFYSASRPGDPQGCAYCHSFLGTANNPLVAHGVSTNPFRLANKLGTAEDNGWNNVCLVCHKTGDPGYDPDGVGGVYASRTGARKVDENHYGTKHNAASKGGTFCWDCHDPHGDADHYMIHSGDGSTAGGGVTAVSDGLYGVPVSSRPVTGLNVTTGGYTSADLVNAANTGLCQTCHAPQGTPGGALYYNRNTFTALASHNGADTTHCTVCHSHTNDFAPSGCNTCHGGSTAGQSPAVSNNWPDSITANTYPDRAGAHAAHIAAIGTGNSACATCHPGNPPSGHPDGSTAPARVSNMDTDGNGTPDSDTSARFLTLSGATDTDGRYNAVTQTCLNINCHGNNETPDWYTGAVVDTTPPVWTTPGLAAADLNQGGAVQVTWSDTAADAKSPPVRYVVTWHTASASVYTAPLGTVDNLSGSSYTVTGLNNGTLYYFGVRARDSVTPTPNTTAGSTPVSATPTAPPPPTGSTTTTYYLSKASGNVWAGSAENMPNCGSTAAFGAAGTTTTSIPPGRGLLATSQACSESPSNYVSNNSPNSGNGTTFESWVGFYTPSTYANGATVSGNASWNSFCYRGSGGSEDLRIYLAAINDSNGAIVAVSTHYQHDNIGTSITPAVTPDLSGLSVTVAAGQRAALIFHWADTSTTASTSDQLAIDNYSAACTNQISLTEVVPLSDTTAPTFDGGASGIVVSNAGNGTILQISWNSATDQGSPTTPPVTYDLFRSTSAATVYGNLLVAGLGGTSYTDTGLATGTTYYYGVRPKDNASPTPNRNNTYTDTASGTPTVNTCTTCHGVPSATGSHLKHAAVDGVYTDCDRCHGNATYSVSPARGGGYTTTGPAGLHNNGSVDIYMRANGETNAAWATPTCSNVDCHSNVLTPTWFGGTVACGTCHGQTAPRTGYLDTGSSVQGAPPLDRAGANAGTKVGQHLKHVNLSWTGTGNSCRLCHKGAGKGSGVHGDMVVQVAFDSYAGALAAWAPGTPGTCSSMGSNCHGNTTWNSTTTLACTACHAVGFGGSFVTLASSHTDWNGSAAGGNTCEGCHAGHADGVDGGANEVEIPTRYNESTNPTAVPTMNRQYASHGYRIRLGGTASSGYPDTEAQMCWGCHDTVGVSEWGVNQNNETGNLPYNYGALHTTQTGTTPTSDWMTGWWKSGKGVTYFSYKTGQIQSTHAANFDLGTANVTNGNALGFNRTGTKDAVANIRCTYCHDVHGTHNGVSGDNSDNDGPFLRGTWKGNPYPEDGAPRAGWANWSYDSATTDMHYGRVPRGSASSSNTGVSGQANLGGYWIDQNSGNPNSGETVASTAGLCIQCHGGDVDTMDWKTGEGLWTSGYNGHANAVIGGSGRGANSSTESYARNIFTRAKRGSATRDAGGTSDTGNVDMGLATYRWDSDRGYSYRSNHTNGLSYYPRIGSTTTSGTGNSEPYTMGYFAWSQTYQTGAIAAHEMATGTVSLEIGGVTAPTGSALTEATNYDAQARYHTFNCGKCHNPHASRLPKLMITNCLDTNHNNWDNGYQAAAAASTIPAVFQGTRASQWPSAQNCHRVDSRAVFTTSPQQTRGIGWNKVTPWLETTTPE